MPGKPVQIAAAMDGSELVIVVLLDDGRIFRHSAFFVGGRDSWSEIVGPWDAKYVEPPPPVRLQM